MQFQKQTDLPFPARTVFDWHARPGALERLNPPWAPVEVVERTGGIEPGNRVVLRVPVGPRRMRWVAEHRDLIPGEQFRDIQIEGPFARWEHTHRFSPAGDDASILVDDIDYEPPFGPLGRLAAPALIQSSLERTFAYRHTTTTRDLERHRRYSSSPLHVAVTGSSGLVGSALCAFLTTGGHRVTRLVRSRPRAGEGAAFWNPREGELDDAALGEPDAVVHLAGENIASGRWTDEVKERIHRSRVAGTRALCEALAKRRNRPKTLVCASAIGFYGDRGDAPLEEGADAGDGFLSTVCREWEQAADAAREAGIRVVHLRIGVVLSAAGGALARMRIPFQLGLGGPLGNGRQYMSWIALDDLLGAILHCLAISDLEGPVNAVSPNALPNEGFTRALSRVVHRPALFRVPASVIRTLFGEMGEELLLASTRVVPRRLEQTGFSFHSPELEDALRHTLGRV